MKRLLVVCFLMVLVSATFVGCASQKAWVYTPNNYSQASTDSNKTAVVLPFFDSRKNINNNRILLYMIPLMPFGWADYDAPEGAQMHMNSGLWTNYRPTEDFAKALAQEIKYAGIFEEAYFDFKKGDSNVIFQGEILSTQYNGKIISYGLSVYGPLLWFVGFPASTVSNELSVKLSCLDSKTNQTLFSKTYSAPEYSKVSWIYALDNDFNYPSMLKGIYKDFVDELMKKQNIF